MATDTAYFYGAVFFLVAFVALLLIMKFNTGNGEIGLILFGAIIVLLALFYIFR